jgi:hypothetical protein
MLILPFECIQPGVQLTPHDLVDEGAGLSQTDVDDRPKHAAALTAADDQALVIQHGEALRDIGLADAQDLG